MSRITIRPAAPSDWPAIWAMIEPVFRAGDTYAVATDITEDAARALWFDGPAACFVADGPNGLLGTYYIKANFSGHADHICNCGYITAAAAAGQGVATAMCTHSLTAARDLGFDAMQFNLVLASNTRAVALWRRLGFATIGTLPQVFRHPDLGRVDAYIMHKHLS
ncbi:GNAT family N-acetyltransferase [Pseudooctadecabacter jejudonensis]|uniref:Acetyltransferase (GNAT) family protein n=1 Tax=Pseudooctadecabacter jejudonensis TaxID=1391910 RepID=A0A1Y5RLQ1_9RHOB|nr:GNAT family N-acetyltransferase [Pseudooctadecabacter jejudonensis]SLN20030.1 Acetyltransferase (GNAT) family protein [Pseudooctadecabacter jejudonensis]